MSFESINNPCPCESGLEYPYCCGASDRSELNILGKINDNLDNIDTLTECLIKAISTINRRPDLYPAKLNFIDNYVHFVKMSPYWYCESVFLDSGRILGTCGVETSTQWLLDKTNELKPNISPIIFHSAFCGSTLMSKALDEIYQCLPVREPEAMNNLFYYQQSPASDVEKNIWFQRVMGLLARRYEKQSPAVIKTSDFSNGLLKDMLIRQPENPVLFMFTPLADFFSSCVKVESRQIWIRERYYAIKPYMSVIAVESIDENSMGQMCAAYWAYNISLYIDALEIGSANLRSLDFNAMLENPLGTIELCAKYFNLTPKKGVKAKDEIRWLMRVYSKDAAFEYSPKKRREDIAAIIKKHKKELLIAEITARKLLAANYPEKGLPRKLNSSAMA